jgi:AcrR family transcriptional regulator
MRVAVDHRETILQTAAKLFARKPFHEVLMDDVAEQAGIAKGTLYRHFENKDDLFGALSMQYLEMLGIEIGKIEAQIDAPLNRIDAMLVRLVELIREHHDFFQVMQRHESNLWAVRGTEFLARRNVMRDCFIRAIRAAESSGELALPFEATYAADMLLGMMRNLLRFSDPQPAPREMARMILHIFVRGLQAGREVGGAT